MQVAYWGCIGHRYECTAARAALYWHTGDKLVARRSVLHTCKCLGVCLSDDAYAYDRARMHGLTCLHIHGCRHAVGQTHTCVRIMGHTSVVARMSYVLVYAGEVLRCAGSMAHK